MMNNNTFDTRCGLEQGLRTDIARFWKLGADLAGGMREAWDFGDEHGAPEHWKVAWLRHWDHVEEVLRQIHELMASMNDSPDHVCYTRRLETALCTWKKLQSDDHTLLNELTAACGHPGERETGRATERTGSRIPPMRTGPSIAAVRSAARTLGPTWKTSLFLTLFVVVIRATFALL